jgi:hypothetical protein
MSGQLATGVRDPKVLILRHSSLGDQVLPGDGALDHAARHSRVCSSMMDTSLMGRPSVVASNWKSAAHTRLGASAVGVSIVVDGVNSLTRAG